MEQSQPPITHDTTLYCLDDTTLKITEGKWSEMTAAWEIAPAQSGLVARLMAGELMIYPGFKAYYHREEAALQDIRRDIEIVIAYANTKKAENKPCSLTFAQTITDLSPDIITHIFNVRRGRAPV